MILKKLKNENYNIFKENINLKFHHYVESLYRLVIQFGVIFNKNVNNCNLKEINNFTKYLENTNINSGKLNGISDVTLQNVKTEEYILCLANILIKKNIR